MIYLKKEKKKPLYLQIYTQIKTDILNGTIKEGEVLSGSRGLAKILGVSRNTVDNAYSQLVAEGYITSKAGIGYAVVKVPRLHLKAQTAFELEKHLEKQPEKQLEKHGNSSVLYDLTNSSHTSDLFPKDLWRRFTIECLDILEGDLRLSAHQDKQGELFLRQRLLSYLQRIRGVHCKEDQIVITCGTQQSLDMICKIMDTSEKSVIMEEPGYNKALAVFTNNHMEVRTVHVDENGLLVDDLPKDFNASAIYTTPSHQFPTGVTMPIDRRIHLLEWAKEKGCYIIEDDFDSEQRYYARPIPSLQSIDENDCVIYLGTFSKGLSPAVRMSYMILPKTLMKVFHEKFSNYNATVPLLNQYVIGRIIETGHYDRHIRRLNQVFKKRLEQFNTEFSKWGNQIRISSNGTGQYFLLEFLEVVSQAELIDSALEQGVKVYSTMEFWQDKAECPANTLFLGFSKIKIEDIPDCVSRLKIAWSKWM